MSSLGRLVTSVGWIWIAFGFFGGLAGLPQINPLPGFIFVLIGRVIRKRGEDESKEVPGLGGNRPVGNRQVPSQPPAPSPVERKPPPEPRVDRMPDPLELPLEVVDEGRLLEDVIESIGGSDSEAYQPKSSKEMLEASQKQREAAIEPVMVEPSVLDVPMPDIPPIDMGGLEPGAPTDDEYRPMTSAEMVERARRRFNKKPSY